MNNSNGMTLMTMQDLVPTFLLPFIPDQIMSLSPSYQRQNTSPPASPFQMMFHSPKVLLTMHSSELDHRKFYNYDGFSTSTAVVTSGPNYIYATTHHLIYISSSITTIIPAAYNIASLVRYCINGLSGSNRPVDVNNIHNFSSSNQKIFDEDPGGYEPTWCLQSMSSDEAI